MRNVAPALRRLGEFIEECDERNTELKIKLSQGVANSKVFQTPKQVAANARGDKIVRSGQFAYNRATTRNGEKISIAYREGPDCTVSGAYQVFRIADVEALDPHYLMLWYLRPEFDRYARYMSKGSAHEFFEFDEMSRVEIPVPPIEVQRKVVEAWQGLRRMKDENENLAEPLMQLCRSYLQECKKKYPMKEIGPMIERKDLRNSDNKVRVVKSVSVQKEFKDTNAKVDKNDLTGYKIVNPGEISFVQTTGNEKCLCMAVNWFGEAIVVTSVNEVMSIDSSQLLADYLYLWWTRKESDRYARFNSWGSARETFNWSEMCRVKIPLPPIEVQQAIVDVYRCAKEAKAIAEEADRLSREICPALVRYAAESGGVRSAAS